MSWSWDSLADTLNSTLASVQDDLDEFTSTLRGDTASAVNDVSAAVSEAPSLETGAQTAFGQLSHMASQVAASLKEDSGQLGSKGITRSNRSKKEKAPVGESREEAQAREIRHSRSTYINDPADPLEFAAWKETFDLSERVTAVSGLLSSDGALRKLHAQLVPNKVSYNQFWIRYFFALHQLKAAGAKRKALLLKMTGADESDDDGDGGWGDDDDWGNEAEATVKTPAKKQSQPEKDKKRRVNLKSPTPPAVSPPDKEADTADYAALAGSSDVTELRAAIKAFDDGFATKNGRRPSTKDRKPIAAVVRRYKEVRKSRESAKPRSKSSSSATADHEGGSDLDLEPEPDADAARAPDVTEPESEPEPEPTSGQNAVLAPAPAVGLNAEAEAETEAETPKMTPEEMAAELAKLKGDEPVDAHGDGPKQSYGRHEGELLQTDLDNVDAALDAMIEAQFADNQAEIKAHPPPAQANDPNAAEAVDISAEIAKAGHAAAQPDPVPAPAQAESAEEPEAEAGTDPAMVTGADPAVHNSSMHGSESDDEVTVNIGTALAAATLVPAALDEGSGPSPDTDASAGSDGVLVETPGPSPNDSSSGSSFEEIQSPQEAAVEHAVLSDEAPGSDGGSDEEEGEDWGEWE